MREWGPAVHPRDLAAIFALTKDDLMMLVEVNYAEAVQGTLLRVRGLFSRSDLETVLAEAHAIHRLRDPAWTTITGADFDRQEAAMNVILAAYIQSGLEHPFVK